MASSPLEQLPSCKRRKVVAAHPVCINDLSAEILKEVATYLAPPSRILFAVAVTPPVSPYETIMARSRSKKQKSSSISGTDWTTLDFGQVEKKLAAELSDKDVRDVLVHINAANKLKKLVLTNCTNITGSGLSPLSGSTTIEQLDLGIAEKFQSPELFPEPRISLKIVLPILDSIISNDAVCKLKYLHFHKAWRSMAWQMREYTDSIDESTESDLYAFLVRYNQMLENRGRISCLKCNQEASEQPTTVVNSCLRSFYNFYGTQRNFCHQCSNYVCWSCPTEVDNVDHYFCAACEREYCTKCVTMARCGLCQNGFCVDSCLTFSCASCNEKLCGECVRKFGCTKCYRTWCGVNDDCYRNCALCDFCLKKGCCVECSKEDKANEVLSCDDCNRGYACSSCLLEKLHKGKLDCLACIKRVAPLIKQLKDENKVLKDENEELKDENRDLKTQIRDWKGVNESLHKLMQEVAGAESKRNP